MEPAPLARRYAALCYEGLLLAAIVLVVGFLTLPALPAGGAGGRLVLPPLPARVLGACLTFGAAGLYFTWCWTGGRRTLPMKTWRLALVRADGRTVDARSAVVRYLAAWIGPAASLAAHAVLQPANLGGVRRIARRHRLPVAARRSRAPIPARQHRGNADRHGVTGSRICLASATPTLISPIPAIASASRVSPKRSHAITAVTAGTRKNSPATFDAAPCRSSQ